MMAPLYKDPPYQAAGSTFVLPGISAFPSDVSKSNYGRREQTTVPAWKHPNVQRQQYYPTRQTNFLQTSFGPAGTEEAAPASSTFTEWHPSARTDLVRAPQTLKETGLRQPRQQYRYAPPVPASERGYNAYQSTRSDQYAEPVAAQQTHVMSAETAETETVQSVWSMNAEQLASRQPQKHHPSGAEFPTAADVQQALSVAGEFAYHYFHLMQTEPDKLHCFYCGDSQLAHGSSVWEHTKWHRAIGESNIERLFDSVLASKMEGNNSLIVRSNVKTIEAQPTRDGGIVMQATGIIETRDLGSRPFAHTIVMNKAHSEGSYVVLHDIFVFLDDVLQLPAPAASRETAFVPSAVTRSMASETAPVPPSDTQSQQLVPPLEPPRIHEPFSSPPVVPPLETALDARLPDDPSSLHQEEDPSVRELPEEREDADIDEVDEEEEEEELPEVDEEEESEELVEEESASGDQVPAEETAAATQEAPVTMVMAEEEPEEEIETAEPVAELQPAFEPVSEEAVDLASLPAPEEPVEQLPEEPETFLEDTLETSFHGGEAEEDLPSEHRRSSAGQAEVVAESEALIEEPPSAAPVNPWRSEEEEEEYQMMEEEPQYPTEESPAESPEPVEEEAPRQRAWKTINRQPAPSPVEPVPPKVTPAVQRAAVMERHELPISFSNLDSNSYAAKLMTGLSNPPPVRGHVLKRSDESASTSPSTREHGGANEEANGYPCKAVWISQLESFSDSQIEFAVSERLKGCPTEGRVIRIERMRNGPAGMIELDSEDCVPLLLERGLCINGIDVRIDLYKQTPSQIVREPSGNKLHAAGGTGGFRRGGGRGRGREGEEDAGAPTSERKEGRPRGGWNRSGGRGGVARGGTRGASDRIRFDNAVNKPQQFSSTEDAAGDWEVVGRGSRRTKSGAPQ
eukprot:Gregarina_sp_Poly_1__1923@NODE_1501_length_3985_cov_621_184022_g993_i1_p1_GENE_NODE_1501_length_3985_cov_621_184022_g993_i1NODE_1501_length_3985_cov_621_184022_g993_i1_p1_ORF_typecomplete_len957_score200_43NTF2/PF02136_20/6_5e11PyrI_C/PF02748_15/0_069_NODE_1501_length_3985_cov_621_184022_g993_i111143846